MINLNTNKSSIITQMNLADASKSLNQAVERMTTGYKINRSKDNAANYSISTNMTTKIGAYSVAEANAGMGLDMLLTAQDTLGEISTGLSKLRSLAVQAQNGTYGTQSLSSINSEASSITNNISQLMSSAQYNGIKLLEAFSDEPALPAGFNQSNMPKADYNGFIENPVSYTDAEINAMTSISAVSSFTSGQKYSIKNADELAKLATLVDDGVDTTGAIFVLADDIDLSAYSSGEGWNPIGFVTSSDNQYFAGIFDGNGHVITNLFINRDEGLQGLFAGTKNNAEIKNVGIVGAEVTGSSYTGALVGYSEGMVSNCYMTGNVTGQNSVGGLAGNSSSSITSCYATGNVTGQEWVGGLAGNSSSSITSCYATGNVTGQTGVGGLTGSSSSITSCYATGNVTGQERVGGLAGSSHSITSCYATGNVTGQGSYVGGLVGRSYYSSSITSCYATGNVTGQEWVGGLVGQLYNTSGSNTATINDCISYSTVSGTNYVGSFLGGVVNTDNGTRFGTINITNSKALSQGLDKISGCYRSNSPTFTPNTHGLDAMLAGISDAELKNSVTEFQVGIHDNESSRISLVTGLKYGIFDALNGLQMEDVSAIPTIDAMIKAVSEKQTELGSAMNRLESVLEEIATQYENLVSSRSTLRDTDIALESSAYIRSQILQQASATLLSTANQTPALALTLLQGVMSVNSL